MALELKDLSGLLFKAKPNANPKWPQYEGSIMIDGVEYWQSAWIKEGKNGKFFSQSFRRKDAPKTKPAAKMIDPDRGPEPDTDDIPF